MIRNICTFGYVVWKNTLISMPVSNVMCVYDVSYSRRNIKSNYLEYNKSKKRNFNRTKRKKTKWWKKILFDEYSYKSLLQVAEGNTIWNGLVNELRKFYWVFRAVHYNGFVFFLCFECSMFTCSNLCGYCEHEFVHKIKYVKLKWWYWKWVTMRSNFTRIEIVWNWSQRFSTKRKYNWWTSF